MMLSTHPFLQLARKPGLFEPRTHVFVDRKYRIPGYDVSNVSTIQISIYRAFGRIDLLPWVVATYSLGNAAMSPIMDHIMKLIDLKLFSICCWTLFLVATAVTGASPTIEGVIVGRTLLGVAGGGCYLSCVIYSQILPFSGGKTLT